MLKNNKNLHMKSISIFMFLFLIPLTIKAQSGKEPVVGNYVFQDILFPQHSNSTKAEMEFAKKTYTKSTLQLLENKQFTSIVLFKTKGTWKYETSTKLLLIDEKNDGSDYYQTEVTILSKDKLLFSLGKTSSGKNKAEIVFVRETIPKKQVSKK